MIDKIEQISNDFSLSIQSAISSARLGNSILDSFREPAILLGEMEGLVDSRNDLFTNNLIVLKLSEMSDELDEGLEQIHPIQTKEKIKDD